MITGKKEVLECLEYWREQTELDQVNYIALAAVKQKHEIAYDYAGAFGVENIAADGLKTCMQELEAIVMARDLGPRDFSKDASYVEWPLSGVAPFNWDFLIWLIDAEMTRRRLGAPAPLRVGFSHEELLLDPVSRKFWERVMRPLLPLIGAVIDQNAIGGRHRKLYVPQDIVVASRGGEEVPRLAASQQARSQVASVLHGVQPVTITLREASHFQHRNSNLLAWTRFAHELEKTGERVVFVRDTAKANEPLPGLATFPRASFDVDTRMALYELSKVNLFISNGPGGLAFFSNRPYLYFVNIRAQDEDYGPNKDGWWYQSNGIGPGEQWPWSYPDQRLIWKTDTYENICEAWEELCAFNQERRVA